MTQATIVIDQIRRTELILGDMETLQSLDYLLSNR
jgi:hypothetical protein